MSNESQKNTTAMKAKQLALFPKEAKSTRHIYVVCNRFGAFCSVCQSHLSMEESDWDECDACGGEGIGGEDEEWDYDEPGC